MGILRYNPEMKIAGLVLVCLLSAVFVLASCGDGEQPPADAVEWGYTGPGAPENWASLSEEYATCADGQQQSPIDITGYEMTDAEPISFLYDSDAAAVRNDGRFVHIDYAPGSMLSVDKQIFELKTAHLHSPSEHWIDGVSFAAELHLVHADADGRLAAVGLLFKMGDAQRRSGSDTRRCPGGRRYRQRRHYAQRRRFRAGQTRLLPVRRLEDDTPVPGAGRLVCHARAEDYFTGAGRQTAGIERRPQ